MYKLISFDIFYIGDDMETKESIQNRIKNRKKDTNLNKRNFPIYRFLMSLLAICSICLSVLIYSKHDEDRMALLCSKIGLDIDFGKVNNNLSSYFDSLIGLDFLKKSFYDGSVMVNSSDVYLPLGDDFYTNDDYSIHALTGGVVVYIVENDSLYDVTVAYDNNVSVVYYSMDELFVSLLDRVEVDDVIARYSDRFKMILLKNGKKINYEELYS